MFNDRHSFSVASASEFMYKVYAWMAFGLGLSAVVAAVISQNPAAIKAIVFSPLRYVLIIAQIGIAMGFGKAVRDGSYATTALMFTTYAALTGATLSVVLLVYTLESVYMSLAITGGTFAAMALYGYFTKADLSPMQTFLTMGIWGLIIASLVNMWFHSTSAQYFISLFGVFVFTLLTAYDTQKIKRLAQETMMEDSESRQKISIMCALVLYLDFVNLFIYLVQLFGKRRD